MRTALMEKTIIPGVEESYGKKCPGRIRVRDVSRNSIGKS